MVYVVAEIGVNWDGNFELLVKMLKKVKRAGCSAVKFQSYQQETVKKHPQRTRLMRSSITKDNVSSVNEIAKSVGVEWFCTPTYPESVDFLEPYVNKYKLRVADGRSLLDNKSTPLLQKVWNTGKPLIVSCEKSPIKSRYYDEPRIKWLYCVPKYPCTLEDLDFSKLNEFDGYSNHCPHIIAPLMAGILGAEILEVHVTNDKSGDFIDNNVSFDFNEVEKLIEYITSALNIKR